MPGHLFNFFSMFFLTSSSFPCRWTTTYFKGVGALYLNFSLRYLCGRVILHVSDKMPILTKKALFHGKREIAKKIWEKSPKPADAKPSTGQKAVSPPNGTVLNWTWCSSSFKWSTRPTRLLEETGTQKSAWCGDIHTFGMGWLKYPTMYTLEHTECRFFNSSLNLKYLIISSICDIFKALWMST